jgi:hypothetical protein
MVAGIKLTGHDLSGNVEPGNAIRRKVGSFGFEQV